MTSPTDHLTAPDGAGIAVDSLWVYPVKSCAGQPLVEAQAEARGLAGDRRWMWIDADDRFISQRTHPALARIRPQLCEEGVVLAVEGHPSLAVSTPPITAPRRTLDVWGGACEGADAGDAASLWLAQTLRIRARLVSHRGRRDVDPRFAAGHEVAFADGFPLLVASAEAIALIARRSGREPDSRRFRPNVVVAGGGPFVEDSWRHIAIGDVEITLVKPCGRCSILDVDPSTGDRDVGLLAALKPDRLVNGALQFGMNAVVTKSGRLRVGDRVRVLAAH